MTYFIPPHIVPPEKLALNLTSLRDATRCVIRTWPATVYEDDFYRLSNGRVIFVMNPEAIREILVERAESFGHGRVFERMFRPVWGKGIFVAEGDEWRWQRKAVAPAFTPAASLRVVPSAVTATNGLIDRWSAVPDRTIAVSEDLSEMVIRIALDALCNDLSDEEASSAIAAAGRYLNNARRRVNVADVLGLPEWTRRLMGPTTDRPAARLRGAVRSAIVARRGSPERSGSMFGLLSDATHPATGRTMAPSLVEDNVVGTLSAARESTALAVAWSLYLIANDAPTQLGIAEEIFGVVGDADLQPADVGRLPLTRQVIMEALRLYPPVHQLIRECKDDITIGGQHISKGTQVVIPIYAVQRHRRLWQNPDAFDPLRFVSGSLTEHAQRFRYLPFGAGPRICIGMAFALAEAITILATLVRAFRFNISAATRIDFSAGVALWPSNGISLCVVPRAPVGRRSGLPSDD
jgi:cytochrome P450